MPIVFAVITPHPPIIVPKIGQPNDLKKVDKTIKAMEKLSEEIAESDPDTIIIISPHAMIHSDRFAVYGCPKLIGNFTQFGAPQIEFKYDNDIELAEKIVKNSNDAGINSFMFGDPNIDCQNLDHGEMVPLYYLRKDLPESTKIVVIAYSYLDRQQHFAFGQVIQQIIDNSSENIAIIASGDLSHRLIQGTPAGYSKTGKDFDKQLLKHIKHNETREILELDEDFIESAGECGFRSILILLGILDNQKYQTEILSYEGPFGVGYLVANFKLNTIK